ncbi:helix-turn-helix transcriptional regulator [Nostoc ellipsosporum NOK]|uniref:helix-turn-helix domain-containing protein n=1 Tax=Sphingomonas sp. IBVSS2 TaxID=1985172 RepID=UPI000A2E333F|nr:helix-turn-helix transcriptional regulator [Sphingomonas sp. IBVSS2]MDF2386101.1 helix-turn-helix transcriptional regulator [Nostoc ellipsosporum NOK]OSZ64387.1 transcriptional regulator [Sphingomonas sp. IBVSS2]
MQPAVRPLGDQIREWRRRRRLSQMDLALDAEISTRHLSFIETGRTRPSREMVLRLADQLALPLRERNTMLLAAGFAPLYAQRALDDPALAAARRAIDLVLKGHEPWPALAIDRHWHLIAANAAVEPLLAGCAPHLLAGPVNVLRLSLHPEGLAPRILNLAEWRAHLLERLRRQAMTTGDQALEALVVELEGYPFPDGAGQLEDMGGVAIPLRLATPLGDLSFISTTTVFGTPLDVTLDELAIEAFYPADAMTAERLRGVH